MLFLSGPRRVGKTTTAFQLKQKNELFYFNWDDQFLVRAPVPFLTKEPKYYPWDWSRVLDPGARAENVIASHLHKAVQFWSDHGFGDFGLYYLRNRQKREVDFCVVRDGKPWLLVEVKSKHQPPGDRPC